MVEFGAKLSLKDNMYATLQKNLKMQQQFSKQVKDTANNIKALAKQKLAPVIRAKDKATAVINKVKNGIKAVGKTVAKPFIAVKDGATKLINKIKNGLKAVGKTVAKPFVWIKDKISAPLKKIGDSLKAVGKFVAKPVAWLKDKATAGLGKIKDMLGSLAKGATIAVSVAGGAIVGGAISEGAKLQQSIGGVETLFGADAGVVMANADKAYKTAGLSANAYMETVTSFSASLLQSLGGDTQTASKIADRAIIDMADNANKFGTDMSSIQTAYAGFAKQNYTMLDNLKLGYGGTKEEMARLIKEASAMKDVQADLGVTVDASSMSFDNIINAISVVQKNMKVTGATAEEASKTFTGSFNAMKASAQNLLGNLAVGGDITGSMEQLVDSAMTFLVGNAIPMLGNIFTALPKAISTGIKKVAPQLKTVGRDLIVSVKEGIIGMLPSSMQGVANNLFGYLGGAFKGVTVLISSVAPILGSLGSAFTTILPTISNVVSSVFPVVNAILGIFGDVVKGILPVVQTIFQGLCEKISTVMEIIGSKMGFFKGIFEQAIPIVASILETAWNVISPIIDIAISVFDAVLSVVEKVFPTIRDIIQGVWDFLKPIFDGLGEGLGWIADGVSKFAGWISGDKKKKKGSSNAYGKDRVPYDNYPAVLHQGEKILTRNQADQYDRQMSTRGVKFTSISSVPQNTAGGGGNSIHIDKLADTVVIEKEADVDKVVEDMVNKFKKLVPNMA